MSRGTRVANWVLAFASLAIYATVGAIYLIPLLFTCLFDYVVGAFLARSPNSRLRTAAFVVSVVVQLSLLCTFKYAGWLTGEINGIAAALGLGIAITQITLPLPPGISFYTFHTISYTADIYQRKFKPTGKFVDYVTFVAFFPQLIAGPIARASELLPQVAARRPAVSPEERERAFTLIAWGLFKKTCVADNLGLIVAQTGAALQQPNPGGLGYIYMYAFAAQIYCDFSAYTDIARGLAKLFGIELTRNFLTPYLSKSPSDFWQRWHISLSRWLRDYLYIPLGGNHRGRLITLRNLAITMFLGGLWHGAGVGFIIWGLYHGLLLDPVPAPADRSAAAGTSWQNWIGFRDRLDVQPGMRRLDLLSRHFVRGLALVHVAGRAAIVAQHGVLLWGLTLFGFHSSSQSCWPIATRSNSLTCSMACPGRRGLALYVALFYGIVFFAARTQNEFIYFQF